MAIIADGWDGFKDWDWCVLSMFTPQAEGSFSRRGFAEVGGREISGGRCDWPNAKGCVMRRPTADASLSLIWNRAV